MTAPNLERLKLVEKMMAENPRPTLLQMGDRIGCSRGAMSSLVYRVKNGRCRPPKEAKSVRTKRGSSWDAEVFEPYSQFKARRQRERAEGQA